MFYPAMFFDPTMIFIVIGLIISGLASWNINRTFEKYDRYQNQRGISATEVAQRLLNAQGITNVSVQRVNGNLTDFYDPDNKVLKLSDATARSTSIAAVGVAAHECGHAMQDQTSYFFLRLRHMMVPAVNFGTNISFVILMAGAFLGLGQSFIRIGILLFSLGFLFQVVTLPVEINASRRAMRALREENILAPEELPYARRTLIAAALTYLAATIASFLSLLRIVLLFGGRSSDD